MRPEWRKGRGSGEWLWRCVGETVHATTTYVVVQVLHTPYYVKEIGGRGWPEGFVQAIV
jgi:hypothetical protein